MKRRIWLVLLTAAVSMSVGIVTPADGYETPTLFHNDEAWYKDSVAPLLAKGGRYHIPVDLLAMFGDITVSFHQNDGNLLVTHTDGTYVSILYDDKTAVIGGEIHDNVGIFRENGYTYVDGEWIADIFSLTYVYTQDENGRTILRLTDSEASRSMTELLQMYREEDSPEGVPETEENTIVPEVPAEWDGIRRIYIVTGDNYENPEFAPAETIIANSGLVCTMFLHEQSDPEKFWTYAGMGGAGICAGSVEEADAVNEMAESMFFRRLEYVLPADNETDREALRQAGYVVIEPDFIVDYSTDPDLVYEELMTYIQEHETAVVKVSGDGCSQRMVALLCNLTADPDWCRAEVLLP
ncbi:MAG: hypothetical protein IJ480_02335 [Clostridia bacterium]|nr:hypothetical protein [Clostridia bacterium]